MPSLADRVYERSPIWLQQAMVAAYGVWWYRRRFGPHFHRFVAELEQRSSYTHQQFREYQARQLEVLFAHARRSKYYGPLLAKRVDDPFEQLARMPLLSKQTFRTSARDLLTAEPPRGTIIQRSSGTTGTPSETYYTREFSAFELAVPEARNLRWAGVCYRDRRVMFGARKICSWDQRKPPFWRTSPVEDMTYCSIYHLSPAYMGAYVDFLSSYRPVVVMGYPSALEVLARFVIERGQRLPGARVVITTSETVTVEARRVIEEAWGCRLWDRYGAVEGCLFASQCEHGRYHVSPDVGIIEILDREGQPAPPGTLGEVVATGLHNTLQPLIRYRLGDAARWAIDQSCACGRSMPILEEIEGRFEDICVTRDGRQVLRFDTVFKGVDNIKQAQVVQTALDRFEIVVEPGPGFGERDMSLLQANMRQHVGDVTTVVTPVDTIPRSASGKFRAVVCRLSADEKRAALGQLVRRDA